MGWSGSGPTDPATLILISLAGGQKHGYAIMSDIAEHFDVTLGAGTLYGALARLQDADLIAPVDSQDRENRRRPYVLTAAGGAAARERTALLRAAAALGTSRLRTLGRPLGGMA